MKNYPFPITWLYNASSSSSWRHPDIEAAGYKSLSSEGFPSLGQFVPISSGLQWQMEVGVFPPLQRKRLVNNCVPWGNCPGPGAGRQSERRGKLYASSMARMVASTSRQLSSCLLKFFSWWSPSGKLSFTPPWQSTLPPPNCSMRATRKKWHIKAWAPWFFHVPPVRQFPGHSGQVKPPHPPYWEQTTSPAALGILPLLADSQNFIWIPDSPG